MKNLSLLTLAGIFGLTLSSGCVLSIGDDADTNNDDVDTTTDDTTTDEGDTGGESGGDEGDSTGNADEVGDGPVDTFGFDDEGGDGGCNCSTEERGGGALLGLFGLVLLGSVRRRRG